MAFMFIMAIALVFIIIHLSFNQINKKFNLIDNTDKVIMDLVNFIQGSSSFIIVVSIYKSMV